MKIHHSSAGQVHVTENVHAFRIDPAQGHVLMFDKQNRIIGRIPPHETFTVEYVDENEALPQQPTPPPAQRPNVPQQREPITEVLPVIKPDEPDPEDAGNKLAERVMQNSRDVVTRIEAIEPGYDPLTMRTVKNRERRSAWGFSAGLGLRSVVLSGAAIEQARRNPLIRTLGVEQSSLAFGSR